MIQYHPRQVILYHLRSTWSNAGCYFCTLF
nr:MAG TPA: hypothetical protein [Caudoviricetes sp.]